MNEKEQARLRQIMAIDQVLESFRAMAPLLHAHYTEMVTAGFTKHQALALTQQFYTHLLQNQKES